MANSPAKFYTARCIHCGCNVVWRATPGTHEPDCCGKPFCRALAQWDEIQWEGRARMAEARRAAGGELNDWDLEALGRVSAPPD